MHLTPTLSSPFHPRSCGEVYLELPDLRGVRGWRWEGLGRGEARGKVSCRCRGGHSREAGVGEQRSLFPGRAQGEIRVAGDVSPPWGNGLLGLRVFYQDPWKDRAGSVSIG
jgi:hypothetical protein